MVNDSTQSVSLYFHIPFCQAKCIYCDFYSVAGQDKKIPGFVQALLMELRGTSSVFEKYDQAETIYFGGGTPSMLQGRYIEKVLSAISDSLTLPPSVEITMEANPGEVDAERLEHYRKLGVNRLSLGLQSFDEHQLQKLGRIHNPEHNVNAVAMARQAGFQNISVDLLFRLPGQTIGQLEKDLEKMIDLNPDHVSIYSLTVESGTPLHRQVHRGSIALPSEEIDAEMYLLVCDYLRAAGYEHYEVSNFSRPGYRSRHNSNYWNGQHYIGYGPAAHSFTGQQRWWNVSDIDRYLKISQLGGDPVDEIEDLDINMKQEEFLLTRLRTDHGIRYKEWKKLFGVPFPEVLRQFFLTLRNNRQELVSIKEDGIVLTEQGWLLNDDIIAQCTELLTARSEL